MVVKTTTRFWQPAPELGPRLLGAYIEPGTIPLHLHEEWQFGVPDSVSKLSLGAFRRFSADVDDVTIVPPYRVHAEGGQLGPPPRWGILYVSPSLIRSWYGNAVPRFHGPIVTDAAAAGDLRDLLRWSAEGRLPGSEFLERVTRWLEQFLARHAENLISTPGTTAVERARDYLQNRPTQAVTLPEVGAVAGVTISHLVRSFSRATGLPPRSFHGQVRLARARLLLAEGKSATWVAHECGFADQSHLSRRFKECYGLTPGAFQDQFFAASGSGATPSAA
jgi:AraC-like DNA-binding protein